MNDKRWEVRKVEEFPDGRLAFAAATFSVDETRLGEMPIPELAEIASDPEFQPIEITESEFEAIWQKATRLRGLHSNVRIAAMTAQHSCQFVVGRRSVRLIEMSISETEWNLRVVVGTGAGWEIGLSRQHLPSVAILEDIVAVWAATRIFFLAAGQEAIRADFDDEVHAVYAVAGRFCIVGSRSVFMYDTDQRAVIDRFLADDDLGTSWWEGGMLFVQKGSSGRLQRFRPSADAVGPEAAP
jgi:hypothetical protein